MRLVTTTGQEVGLPDADSLVHLQFRRFAGCPICNLHLQSFVRRHAELGAAGIREVVLFHSSREALLRHAADLPFAMVPDPARRLYRAFGVATAARALTDPRAWPSVLRSVGSATVGFLVTGRPLPPVRVEGGRLGLPADFLIARDGHVLAAKYGAHADDQWSVDQLLAIAAGATEARSG